MQSTAVDVVSVNPADGIDADAGQASKYVTSAAAVAVVAGAAEATEVERAGVSAAKTAIAAMTPIRRFRWESMLPPC
jgi:hypothetical protein